MNWGIEIDVGLDIKWNDGILLIGKKFGGFKGIVEIKKDKEKEKERRNWLKKKNKMKEMKEWGIVEMINDKEGKRVEENEWGGDERMEKRKNIEEEVGWEKIGKIEDKERIKEGLGRKKKEEKNIKMKLSMKEGKKGRKKEKSNNDERNKKKGEKFMKKDIDRDLKEEIEDKEKKWEKKINGLDEKKILRNMKFRKEEIEEVEIGDDVEDNK